MVRTSSAVIAALSLCLGAPVAAKQSPQPPINISAASPTIQTVAIVPPAAPQETYGDWKAFRLDTGAYMATVQNDAGSVLATLCTGSTCHVVVNPHISCDPGSKYPALVNAPSSAFAVTFLCEKLGDLLVYSVPLDTVMSDAMSIGGVLGVAMPMASGEFKAARFSLTGSARATARIQQLATDTTPASTEKRKASDEKTL